MKHDFIFIFQENFYSLSGQQLYKFESITGKLEKVGECVLMLSITSNTTPPPLIFIIFQIIFKAFRFLGKNVRREILFP